MKIYLHISKNRPLIYAIGRDGEFKEDTKTFVGDAEQYSHATFTPCQSPFDYEGSDGSNIHILDISRDTINRHLG